MTEGLGGGALRMGALCLRGWPVMALALGGSPILRRFAFSLPSEHRGLAPGCVCPDVNQVSADRAMGRDGDVPDALFPVSFVGRGVDRLSRLAGPIVLRALMGDQMGDQD
jgi:hypothetical protein